MKRIVFTIDLMIMALVLSGTCLSQGIEAKKKSGKAESQIKMIDDDKLGEELIGLYKAWREARNRGDKDTMSRITADEWIITPSTGTIIEKAQSLEGAKPESWKNDVIPPITDLKARRYGDTAVLIFNAKGDIYYRYLFVWVKRQGRWQWVAGQQTKLAEQPSR